MTGREPVRGRGYARLVTGMPQRTRDARMLRALIATLVVIGPTRRATRVNAGDALRYV